MGFIHLVDLLGLFMFSGLLLHFSLGCEDEFAQNIVHLFVESNAIVVRLMFCALWSLGAIQLLHFRFFKNTEPMHFGVQCCSIGLKHAILCESIQV